MNKLLYITDTYFIKLRKMKGKVNPNKIWTNDFKWYN